MGVLISFILVDIISFLLMSQIKNVFNVANVCTGLAGWLAFVDTQNVHSLFKALACHIISHLTNCIGTFVDAEMYLQL